MHNPESVLGNETHKSLWDFEIQSDNLISIRPSDCQQKKKSKKKKKKRKKKEKRKRKNKKKRTCWIVD